VFGDVPAVNLTPSKIDVGDKCSIFSFLPVEKFQSIFTRRSYFYLKFASARLSSTMLGIR
jgi:hypothetical protein